MNRFVPAILILCLLTTFLGCSGKATAEHTVEGNIRTYYELTDGTWLCDDIVYEHRLELEGRLYNAACDTVYVYLSNVPITFQQAWLASGLSSNTADYFTPEDAVLVEMHTINGGPSI